MGFVYDSVSAMIPQIAHDFHWKHNKHALDQCKADAALVIGIAKSVMLAMAVMVGPTLEALKVPAGSFINAAGIIAQQGIGVGLDALRPKLEKAMCAGVVNAPEDSMEQLLLSLEKGFKEMTVAIRQSISHSLSAVNEGKPPANVPLLSELLRPGNFALTDDEERRFRTDPELLIGNMSSWMEKRLISFGMKTNHCHVHCVATHNSKNDKTCIGKDGVDEEKNKGLKESRFCPTPDTICQAQCWRDHRVDPQVIPVHGYKLLLDNEKWDFDMEDLVKQSHKNYVEYGLGNTNMEEMTDLALGENNPMDGLRLPVCYSENIPLGRLGPKLKKGEASAPCSCGPNGNETQLFKDAIDWAMMKTVDQWEDKCGGEINEKDKAPANNFLSHCENRTPKDDKDGDKNPNMTKFIWCDPVKKMVNEMKANSSTDKNINCHFCMQKGGPGHQVLLHTCKSKCKHAKTAKKWDMVPDYFSLCKDYMKVNRCGAEMVKWWPDGINYKPWG
jgi:hypothetical protein